ncbi:hypothetical protein EON64_13530, partial [archaeon]
MKGYLDRKFQKLEIVNKRLDNVKAIDREEVSLQQYARKQEQITRAREFYAASRISALIRGFLDRIACKRLRRYYKAVRLIQRLMKGKLGRMRWQREYWRSISVVKSDYALQEILQRSRLLRENTQAADKKRHWQELFDPLTQSFWYYNLHTRQNTWQVPFCFQKTLVCSWDGHATFGGLSPPCRAVFSNLQAFQNHMKDAHPWFCSACFQRNPGVLFPICGACENKYSEKGQDGERVLREAIARVQKRLSEFLKSDMDEKMHGSLYSIRERLVEIARHRVESIEEIDAVKKGILSSHSKREKLVQINERYQTEKNASFTSEVKKMNRLID